MSNICSCTYKVRADRKTAADLWEKLQVLGVNEKSVWLCDLAKEYGIDYKQKGISVRGQIYRGDFEEDFGDDTALISLDAECAWSGCNEFFDEINAKLGDVLSVSVREIEPGCEVYYVHDEGDFFPEECCVSADGEPFGTIYEEPFDTISDAINLWVSLTGVPQGDRTDDEMVEFINAFGYLDDCTYFYIHPFTFV